MRYESLGNEEEALYSYTEAMRVWHPTAVALFRRGCLYYRRKEWAKACADLKQALAFPSEEGLSPGDRKQAERYVAELEEILAGQ